jgi:hypothetical protein
VIILLIDRICEAKIIIFEEIRELIYNTSGKIALKEVTIIEYEAY